VANISKAVIKDVNSATCLLAITVLDMIPIVCVERNGIEMNE
jgi:hypothetical protein